jgi:hypothetical protein
MDVREDVRDEPILAKNRIELNLKMRPARYAEVPVQLVYSRSLC